MDRQECYNKMYWEIHQQGAALAGRMDDLVDEEAAVVGNLEVDGLSGVQQVGCGDSHFVGWASKLAFQSLAGLPLTPAEAYEFAAYEVEGVPHTALAVGVSVSGKVGHTITAVERAGERGMPTLAITNTPGSAITRAADRAIVVDVHSPGGTPVPGTLTYLGSLTTLYLLAIELGLARGYLAEQTAVAHRTALKQNHLSLREIALANFPLVERYARRRFHASPIVYFVGGGPNYGSALFGRAKLLEAAPVPCVAQEVEEWAHLEYFLTGPDTQIVFLAPAGPSRERSLDMMRTARRVNAYVIAIADPADAEVAALAQEVWPVPPQEEIFSPIAYSVPLDILAYNVMITQGSAPFRLDSSGNSGVIYREEK
jgi:glucosamine--fructose-6-phosphate aminotransferase (isomerizing)